MVDKLILIFSLKRVAFRMWKLCHLPVVRKSHQCFQAISSNMNLKLQRVRPQDNSVTQLCLWAQLPEENLQIKANGALKVGCEKPGKGKRKTCLISVFPQDQISSWDFSFSKPFQTWTWSKWLLFGEVFQGPTRIGCMDGGIFAPGDQTVLLRSS